MPGGQESGLEEAVQPVFRRPRRWLSRVRVGLAATAALAFLTMYLADILAPKRETAQAFLQAQAESIALYDQHTFSSCATAVFDDEERMPDLYLVDGARGTAERLTHDRSYEKPVAMLPDGSGMLVSVSGDSLDGLYLSDLRFTDKGFLYSDPQWREESLRFFRGGEGLLYQRYDGSRFSLMRYDLGSRTLSTVASVGTGDAHQAVWESFSPALDLGGTVVAYNLPQEGKKSIVIEDLTTGRKRLIQGMLMDGGDFLPEGMGLVFAERGTGRLYRHDLVRGITSRLAETGTRLEGPSVSPDGTLIAGLAGHGLDSLILYDSRTGQARFIGISRGVDGQIESIAWTGPRSLVMGTFATDGERFTTADIDLVRVGEGLETRITDILGESRGSWEFLDALDRRGKRVIFRSDKDATLFGSFDRYAWHPDDGSVTRLTRFAESADYLVGINYPLMGLALLGLGLSFAPSAYFALKVRRSIGRRKKRRGEKEGLLSRITGSPEFYATAAAAAATLLIPEMTPGKATILKPWLRESYHAIAYIVPASIGLFLYPTLAQLSFFSRPRLKNMLQSIMLSRDYRRALKDDPEEAYRLSKGFAGIVETDDMQAPLYAAQAMLAMGRPEEALFEIKRISSGMLRDRDLVFLKRADFFQQISVLLGRMSWGLPRQGKGRGTAEQRLGKAAVALYDDNLKGAKASMDSLIVTEHNPERRIGYKIVYGSMLEAMDQYGESDLVWGSVAEEIARYYGSRFRPIGGSTHEVCEFAASDFGNLFKGALVAERSSREPILRKHLLNRFVEQAMIEHIHKQGLSFDWYQAVRPLTHLQVGQLEYVFSQRDGMRNLEQTLPHMGRQERIEAFDRAADGIAKMHLVLTPEVRSDEKGSYVSAIDRARRHVIPLGHVDLLRWVIRRAFDGRQEQANRRLRIQPGRQEDFMQHLGQFIERSIPRTSVRYVLHYDAYATNVTENSTIIDYDKLALGPNPMLDFTHLLEHPLNPDKPATYDHLWEKIIPLYPPQTREAMLEGMLPCAAITSLCLAGAMLGQGNGQYAGYYLKNALGRLDAIGDLPLAYAMRKNLISPKAS